MSLNTKLITWFIFAAFLFSNPAFAEDWIYTIKSGDTIWDLNKEQLEGEASWLELLKKNGISSPKSLQPGTKISIPMALVKKHPSYGVVTKVNGDVFIATELDSPPLPLKSGMILSAGDNVITGDKSSALLVFVDKSSILVQANSNITLIAVEILGKQESQTINLEIDLQQGEIEVEANPNKVDNSRYRIKTPIASTAVKGTRFYVQSDPKVSRVGVVSGSVSVGNDLGNVALPTGTGTKSEKGKAPIPPVVLLPKPVVNIPNLIRYLPHPLNMPTQGNASQYRFEISSSADFVNTIMDSTIEKLFSLPNSLIPGEYFIRVRGVDKQGIQGNPLVQKIIIDLLPEKPTLKSLPENTQHTGDIIFSWETVDEADNYLFELSQNHNFSAPLYRNEKIAGSTLTLNLLEPGDYFFRVSGLSSKSQPGKLSNIHTLHLFSPLEKPKIRPPLSLIHDLVVEWSALNGALRYQVQLSTTPTFQSIISSQETTETKWESQRVGASDYYVKICGIDKLDTIGPCSSSQLLMPPSERRIEPAIYQLNP